ncbi:hypothetical protein GCM10009763_19200 [Dermacoccus profundi]|uniref:Uncharacterized protein n=2 Tax=Dermacoccus TaxID=57495 RepID=A0A417Z191_9MICO|nr:hypothetical protein D1832_14240 [Dermacoccus abyssi]
MYPTSHRRDSDPLSTIFPLIIMASTFVAVLLVKATIALMRCAFARYRARQDRQRVATQPHVPPGYFVPTNSR